MEDLKIFDENGKKLHIADVISRLFELERFDIDPQ
jgi:hypothetical protein